MCESKGLTKRYFGGVFVMMPFSLDIVIVIVIVNIGIAIVISRSISNIKSFFFLSILSPGFFSILHATCRSGGIMQKVRRTCTVIFPRT